METTRPVGGEARLGLSSYSKCNRMSSESFQLVNDKRWFLFSKGLEVVDPGQQESRRIMSAFSF
jgi:hypothetical protein